MGKKSFAEILKKNAMLVVLVLVYLFFMIRTQGSIFNPSTFRALFNENAYVYILGCGMLMCMLTGGNIDLSCGAFVCLLGAIGGVLMVISGVPVGLSIAILLAIGVAYGCDVMAYFGGRTFGRHKLCPSVSPKKTVEGAVSGVLGSVRFALGVRAFFVHLLSTPMPGIPAAILLGVIGSVASQVGDLTASLLKRHSGIKDYGKLFPGHGGVMDRFDSVIFALIVMYCYTLVLK